MISTSCSCCHRKTTSSKFRQQRCLIHLSTRSKWVALGTYLSQTVVMRNTQSCEASIAPGRPHAGNIHANAFPYICHSVPLRINCEMLKEGVIIDKTTCSAVVTSIYGRRLTHDVSDKRYGESGRCKTSRSASSGKRTSAAERHAFCRWFPGRARAVHLGIFGAHRLSDARQTLPTES